MDDGATLLLMAAQNGSEAVVRALIEAGADINKATDDGVTPLTPLLIAGHFGNEAIVQILKDAGAV